MPTLVKPDLITVWFEDGLPSRAVWCGTRYRVTDTPTPLFEEVGHPMLTHPAKRQVGWRFQGTPDRGPSLVFDVRPSDGYWELVRVYD